MLILITRGICETTTVSSPVADCVQHRSTTGFCVATKASAAAGAMGAAVEARGTNTITHPTVLIALHGSIPGRWTHQRLIQ